MRPWCHGWPHDRPRPAAGGHDGRHATGASRHRLKQPKLPAARRDYNKFARASTRDGVDHPRTLLRLIDPELRDRKRRTVERRIWAARFPPTKSFNTVDFTAIPGLNKMLMVAGCKYILRRDDIIALGNRGTGKTHVTLALGVGACQKFPRLRSPRLPRWFYSL